MCRSRRAKKQLSPPRRTFRHAQNAPTLIERLPAPLAKSFSSHAVLGQTVRKFSEEMNGRCGSVTRMAFFAARAETGNLPHWGRHAARALQASKQASEARELLRSPFAVLIYVPSDDGDDTDILSTAARAVQRAFAASRVRPAAVGRSVGRKGVRQGGKQAVTHAHVLSVDWLTSLLLHLS